MITALGFSAAQEILYMRLLAQSGSELASIANTLFREPDSLVRDLEPFVVKGIVRVEGDRIHVAEPGEALALLLRQTADSAFAAEACLREVAAALPFLSATAARPRPGETQDVERLDGELSSGGNVPGLLTALILQSKGDLLQLRPDQWRSPDPDPMADLLHQVVRAGRRLRTIYPVRAAQEAPEVLRGRIAIGEEVRLLPDVPTRMLVIGRTHAILPEPLGYVDEPRSLIRQRGIVEAMLLLFEEMWDRASPVPDLGGGPASPDLRRFLLQQLAGGSQDEQIARRLGISLRTVRRRVAELMSELGAESRFQAGVEAARRGWL